MNFRVEEIKKLNKYRKQALDYITRMEPIHKKLHSLLTPWGEEKEKRAFEIHFDSGTGDASINLYLGEGDTITKDAFLLFEEIEAILGETFKPLHEPTQTSRIYAKEGFWLSFYLNVENANCKRVVKEIIPPPLNGTTVYEYVCGDPS